MNVKKLFSFIMLYQTLNFNETAKKLFITQSALSKQITSLENKFGKKLFIRHYDGIYPTQASRKVYQDALVLLKDLEKLIDKTSLLAGDLRETLFIGTSMPATYPIAKLSASFSANNNIELKLTSGTVASHIQSLREGLSHLAFLNTPVLPPLDCIQVSNEKLVLVINKAHLRPNTSIHTYFQELPLIGLSPDYDATIARETHRYLITHHINPMRLDYVNDIFILQGLVSANLGIGIVYESAAAKQDSALEFVTLSGMHSAIPLYLAWNPEIENKTRDVFVEFCINCGERWL
ncbi:LysR family transcriptional regulator [Erwinia sp. HR93]|uniref:LysR family transcriptional regulator n=1 Tax=Erwinia sp. HR93 TaxID=3094840 RepID=UPI002ADEE229|nr:LysR family transcriptional regulator [Erwinia sp. HR93]MEA1063766.1 LysR family transcriptional regulator [Erwinia sp. HR93]